jgi:hypothetical protein
MRPKWPGTSRTTKGNIPVPALIAFRVHVRGALLVVRVAVRRGPVGRIQFANMRNVQKGARGVTLLSLMALSYTMGKTGVIDDALVPLFKSLFYE